MITNALDERSGTVGLPEAAAILGVHRATVNDMVRSRRLPAARDGAHWAIRRSDLADFAASYEKPRNAPPPRRPHGLLPTTQEVLSALGDLGAASVAEVHELVDLHEGNVRKHLRILEAKNLAARDADGNWELTPAGEAHQRTAQGN